MSYRIIELIPQPDGRLLECLAPCIVQMGRIDPETGAWEPEEGYWVIRHHRIDGHVSPACSHWLPTLAEAIAARAIDEARDVALAQRGGYFFNWQRWGRSEAGARPLPTGYHPEWVERRETRESREARTDYHARRQNVA